MPRRSSMKHDFARIPSGNVPRSSFDLAFTHKTTFDGGLLIPFHWDYRYPGDVDRCSVDSFIRMSSPLDYPLMDNATVTVHWHAVALRNIWDNFRKFFGEQEDPGDSIDYTVPTVYNTTFANTANTIFDYMGIPLGTVKGHEISALPFRAYNFIWNYWYRSQDVQNSLTVNKADGNDSAVSYTLQNRGKRHDYFTSCATAPQKHDAVDLPLGTEAPVIGIGKHSSVFQTGPVSSIKESDGGTATYADYSYVNGSSAGDHTYYVEEDPDNAGYPNIHVDLSSATAATINELRNAFAIQQFLEREMRGGTRFGEQIWSHFQVEFQDAHYAPVYLGGGSAPLIVSPIANQSGSTGNVGDLAAIASAGLRGAGFTYAYTEPCILMGLICVDADLTYQQGLERKFSYSTRYDFYWPEFAGLGEQAVLNKELWYSNAAVDDNAFGYQERHAELRHGVNRISGEFRSDHGTSLDSWHLAEDFATLPTLNSDFMESDPPFDRVMQVSTAKHFIADIRVNLKTARPMPLYGVPGLSRL